MAQEEPNINAGDLQKDLLDAKAKCEEYLNGWKRERADFLNYKKDEMERIGQLVKYSNEELILKIIPILDNIYLCINAQHHHSFLILLYLLHETDIVYLLHLLSHFYQNQLKSNQVCL